MPHGIREILTEGLANGRSLEEMADDLGISIERLKEIVNENPSHVAEGIAKKTQFSETPSWTRIILGLILLFVVVFAVRWVPFAIVMRWFDEFFGSHF